MFFSIHYTLLVYLFMQSEESIASKLLVVHYLYMIQQKAYFLLENWDKLNTTLNIVFCLHFYFILMFFQVIVLLTIDFNF